MQRLTDEQRVELKKWQSDHRWSPNQLRHTAATEIRRNFGVEATATVLGHAKADVTQIHAERDLALAAEVARQIG
jgi:integrase